MSKFIYEFLWRGKPGGSGDYHVIIGNSVDDGFGGSQIVVSPALTPQQAADAGFPLSAIVKGVNAGFVAQVEKLNTDLATVQAERDGLDDALKAAQLAQLKAEAEAENKGGSLEAKTEEADEAARRADEAAATVDALSTYADALADHAEILKREALQATASSEAPATPQD